MLQRLSRKILFDWLGFSEHITEPLPAKCVIALAPHTSNWDFVIGRLYASATGQSNMFLMKKEWFFWPLGILMRRIGGIPVHRNKKTNITDSVAEQAKKADTFRVCVTPEGTRKANADWKKGFYYIALKANIPILLYGLDFKTRSIVCTKKVIPNGDIESQLQEIKDYYRFFTGKHPHQFAL
ncbi:MAG: 1-acyl-sn-glycerol-3-phosphate acyltransferase [Bacteroidaceae bacterium]|nr:1-acyl-sn-glycerol-3-phosphate acyltransferase [Bacteroidaceae bacterium]